MRLGRSDKSANKLAERAHQFREINKTNSQSIIIPLTTSMRREYIPIGFKSDDIATNSSSVIYDSEIWIFSLLISKIHTLWMKTGEVV